MLYLIQQALKTAKQKELEAEQPEVRTIGYNHVQGHVNLTQSELTYNEYPYTTSIGSNIIKESYAKEGDRYSDYRNYIRKLLEEYVEELDEDDREMLQDDYSYVFDTDDSFHDWAIECDILLHNDTFSEDCDLMDLINDYFEGYL